MTGVHKHFVLAWLLIAAQLCVIVVGHGRVVVCHDAGGASHIELVSDASCSVLDDTPCGQPTGYKDTQEQSMCADTSCQDELLGFTYTTRSMRKAEFKAPLTYTPSDLCALQMLAKPFRLVAKANMPEHMEEPAVIRARLLALRSTVLVI